MRRIVILGGGVTGLALGYLRNRCPAPGDDVLILEEGPSPGGTVRTIREEGLVLEAGPVTLRTTPASDRLVEALGLEDDVLVADPRSPRWIVRGGRMRRVTPGPSLLLGGALPLAARLRALAEPFVARRPADLADESVHDFFERRFGPGVARWGAEPLVSGVWADDPRTLSVRSAFPALWDAEGRAGSVLRGLAGAPRPRSRRTISFRGGLGTLAERLAEQGVRAGVRIELDAEIAGIEGPFDGEGNGGVWKVQIADGTVYPADTLVSTLDAPSFAEALGPRLPRSGARLATLPYSRLAVVLQAFRADSPDAAPRGFGLLAPRGEGLRSLGVLYLSSLFPSRVPAGVALTTSFFGGALDPSALDLCETDLLRIAEAEVRRLHPDLGPRLHGRALKWPSALPRLPVGHHETLRRLDADLDDLNAGRERPRLVVTGTWRDGLGLGERIARAEELAPLL
ncbi:MAG TPA: protoporphyrinogen oxidase [Thermoanaerobaculia bacterium]|nr:protoporphyrinogen oxidase [Thermoanaerobaculia bacterium]HPA50103.1 protoporphyrinogen oxidase [Thermoanaerobaculia bacterium]HQN06752.1 protoporphyrinogen oxidase [Thermoanaerobaculia bacterium]HQP85329.1 protoporphyrinogen oxidase [Thermoanaerobaculia bacterium]